MVYLLYIPVVQLHGARCDLFYTAYLIHHPIAQSSNQAPPFGGPDKSCRRAAAPLDLTTASLRWNLESSASVFVKMSSSASCFSIHSACQGVDILYTHIHKYIHTYICRQVDIDAKIYVDICKSNKHMCIYVYT